MATRKDQNRQYGGISPEERKADRRKRLIRAAVQVYGQSGYRNATVKAVCAAAGLTERYFYESFANSEELLLTAYEAVTYSLYKKILRAAQEADSQPEIRARIMLHTYFTALKEEPLNSRFFLVEMRGLNKDMPGVYEKALKEFREKASQLIDPAVQQTDPLLQMGVLGGIIQIAIHWVDQRYQPSVEEVTDTAMKLTMVLLKEK